MMKKLTKLISLIVCLSMLCAFVNIVQAAESTVIPSARTQSLLSSLGFFDSFSDQYVTRREFVTALLRAGGRLGMTTRPSDEELSGMARQANLIGVYDDGKAGLDTYITYGEVLAGFIYTLGYDVTMSTGERTLNGMMAKANRFGISRGFDKNAKANVTGYEFAELFSRMLTVDVMKISSYTEGGFKADIKKGYTLLEVYHDIYRMTGQVTANQYSTLYEAVGLGAGRVRIGDEILYTGNTDADFYLGYTVDCYYLDVNDEKTLVWIEKDENCEELYLQSHEISGYAGGVYEYVQNNRMRTARLAANVSVVYNSVAVRMSDLMLSQMIPQVGEVSLIDGDGNHAYETLIIMDYDSYVSGGANEQKLLDNSGSTVLTFAEVEEYNIYDKNYCPLAYNQILANSILWVAKSADGQVVNVLVSTDSVSGIVRKRSEEDGFTYVTVDGREYRISKKCDKGDQIALGTSAVFYLDHAGDIAGFRVTASADMKLGYVYNWAETGAFGDTIKLRIFDGEHKSYECASRVEVNRESQRGLENITKALRAEDGSFLPQLIRYRTNEEGLLVEYETAITLAEGQEESDRLFIEGEIPASDTGDAGLYYSAGFNHLVLNYFAFDSSSKIFIIPSDLSETDDFEVGSASTIPEQQIHGITAYKTDSSSDFVAAGVWRDSAASSDKSIVSSDTPYLVIDIYKTLVNETEEAVQLKYASGFTVQEIMVDDEDLVDILLSGEVKPGDLVRFDTGSNGNMATFTKDYDYATHTVSDSVSNSFTAKYRLANGHVTKKMTTAVKMKNARGQYSPLVPDELIFFSGYSQTRVALVNIIRDNITITNGSISDVNKNDEIVIMSRNGYVLWVYIIKD